MLQMMVETSNIGTMKGALRAKEAASYMGMSASTLAKWRMWGMGPDFVRLGKGRIVYRITDLDAFMASRVETAKN